MAISKSQVPIQQNQSSEENIFTNLLVVFQKFFKMEKFQIFSTFNQNQHDFHSRDGIFKDKLHRQCKTERSKVPL